jgi:DNA-binding transcriptional ArsR family regulator
LPDPWWLQRWAYETKTGNPGRKAVLSMLATMADSNSARCEGKQDTIAEGVELSVRAVGGHLKVLEEAGLIARRPQFRVDRGRRADEFLLLAPGITAWPDGEAVQSADSSGGPDDADGTPGGVRPRGGQERPLSGNGRSSRQDSSAGAPDAFPDDLPSELHDVAIAAGKILKATAIARGQAREVTRAAVGHAVLTYPDRDHVQVAREVEAWVMHGRGARKPCSDIAARFRNFLQNADPRPGPPLAGGGGQRRPSGPSTGPSTLRAMAADLRNATE